VFVRLGIPDPLEANRDTSEEKEKPRTLFGGGGNRRGVGLTIYVERSKSFGSGHQRVGEKSTSLIRRVEDKTSEVGVRYFPYYEDTVSQDWAFNYF